MTISASESDEEDGELYSIVADVAAIYGDTQGKYIAYLNAGEPTYATDAYFLWDQPLPGGEKESAGIGQNVTSQSGAGGGMNNNSSNGAAMDNVNLFIPTVVCATMASVLGSILGL
jgi:hypothetical protein